MRKKNKNPLYVTTYNGISQVITSQQQRVPLETQNKNALRSFFVLVVLSFTIVWVHGVLTFVSAFTRKS